MDVLVIKADQKSFLVPVQVDEDFEIGDGITRNYMKGRPYETWCIFCHIPDTKVFAPGIMYYHRLHDPSANVVVIPQWVKSVAENLRAKRKRREDSIYFVISGAKIPPDGRRIPLHIGRKLVWEKTPMGPKGMYKIGLKEISAPRDVYMVHIKKNGSITIVPGSFSTSVYMRRTGDSYVLSAKIPQVEWEESNGYKYMLKRELDETREIDWLRTKNVFVIEAPIKNGDKSAAQYPDIYSRTHPSAAIASTTQPQQDANQSTLQARAEAVQKIYQ